MNFGFTVYHRVIAMSLNRNKNTKKNILKSNSLISVGSLT